MKLKDLQLTDEDHQRLQKLVKYGDDWRERDRAQTILYFAAGWRAHCRENKPPANQRRGIITSINYLIYITKQS